MKIRNTIILLIIAALIGGYIYLYERKQLTTEEKKERAGKVFAFKSEDVTKLEIKKGEETIVCRKESKTHWQIEKPLHVRADESEIDKILSKLEFLKRERTIAEEKGKPLAVEEFGIAQPQMEVSIWVKDEPFALLLGKDSPAGNNIYAGLKGRKEVYLVEKGVIDTLNKKVNDLRDRKIVRFSRYDAKQLGLYYPGNSIFCSKDEKGDWKVTSPLEMKADKDTIDDILKELEDLKVKEFVTEEGQDLSLYNLSTPEVKVMLAWGEKSEKESILFSKKDETLYVKNEYDAPVYSIETGLLDKLPREILALKDKRVLAFEREGIEKLQLRSQDVTILCGKENDQWQVLEPEKAKAKESEINDILWALEGLKAKKFVQSEKGKEEEYGLAKPEFELTLSLKDNVTKTIIVGKEVSEESAHYAKTSDTDAIFLLDSEKVKTLKKDLKDLKEEPEKKEGVTNTNEKSKLSLRGRSPKQSQRRGITSLCS